MSGTVVPLKGESSSTPSESRLIVLGGIGWLFDAMDVLLLSYLLAYLGVHYAWTTADKANVLLANDLGLLVGALLFGRVADRWGRRRAFMATLIIYSVLAAAMGFFTSPVPLLFVRFLMGLGLGGELPVVSSLVSELSSPGRRGRNVVLLESFWSYGTILAGALAAFVLPLVGYSVLMWALAATALYAAVLRRGVPEPERARGALPLSSMFREERGRLIPAWVAWFAIAFGYYGFALWLPSMLVRWGLSLVSSLEFSFAMTLLQVPGYFSAAYLVERWGRRPTFASYMAISAASALALAFSHAVIPVLAAGSLFNFFNLGAWGTIYAYSPELFSDRDRATAVGSCTAMARIGMIVGPYLPAISGFGTSLGAFFAALLVGASSVAFLPETVRRM
jgi:putative MFS transporter